MAAMIRDLVILTPVYVSFFWAMTFLLNKFTANKARYWLGMFMSVTAVLYFCHALFFFRIIDIYLDLDFLYLITGLSVYPMYYIYIRLLTCDLNLRRSYLLHFIPAIILGVALFVAHKNSSPAGRELYYSNVLIKNRWPDKSVGTGFMLLSSIFYLSRIIFGFQALGYLLLGYNLVRRYNKRIVDFYSNTEGRELTWVKLLTVSFLITSFASSVANFVGRGVFLENTLLLTIPSVLFSSLFFIIGLLGNKQDFTIKSFNDDEQKDEPEFKKPVDHKIEKLKNKLLSLLEDKKRYLDPELKITDMCSELNTNRTYISNLINSEFRLNFNDLINKYRVDHSISLLKDGMDKNYSLQAIAAASGFGSLSSFNRAFKKNTGTTVSSYKNKISGRYGEFKA